MNTDHPSENKANIRCWLLVTGILLVILLDVFVINRSYYQDRAAGLRVQTIKVASGRLKDLEISSNRLMATSDDPSVVFEPLNIEVRSITLACINPNNNSLAQIFYRTPGQPYSQENSSVRSIALDQAEITFSKILYLEGIRVDLTNQSGDQVRCSDLTINRKAYTYHYILLPFYASIIGLLALYAANPQSYVLHSTLYFFKDTRLWIYIAVIFAIDLLFNLIFAYDSAHYLWLAELIDRGRWAAWDPMRNPVFPMLLNQILSLLGNSQLSLQLLLAFAHALLFALARDILLMLFPGRRLALIILGELTLLLLVVFNPVVFGYYHVMLTEFWAATLGMFSVWLAVKVWQSSDRRRYFVVYSTLTLLLTLIAWHVKQSYFVVTLTPYIMFIFCTFLNKKDWNVVWRGLLVMALIVASLLATTNMWNNFLVSKGNPMSERRSFSRWLSSTSSSVDDSDPESNTSFIGNWLQKYLVMSNFWGTPPVLGNAYQNEILAYRTYSKDLNNTFFVDNLDRFISGYRAENKSPAWLNSFFVSRQHIANVLYTILNLFLPLFSILALIIFIVHKDLVSFILLTLQALSFANVLMHVLSNAGPLDRYAFIGYPLNLLALLIWIVLLIQWVSSRLRQSAPAPHPLEDHVVTDSEPNPDKP